jgi:hypothetical protein
MINVNNDIKYDNPNQISFEKLISCFLISFSELNLLDFYHCLKVSFPCQTRIVILKVIHVVEIHSAIIDILTFHLFFLGFCS